MSFPLWDLAKDLAVARGGKPAVLDADDPLTLRRRIAAIATIPGLALAVVLGGWTGRWVVGLIAALALLAGMWVFAERGDRIAARLRRRDKAGDVPD